MAEYPAGTVTFLFTDIEGSTPLWEQFPDQMEPALSRHDQIVRDCAARFAGYVFSTAGDGFGIAFQSATDAVAAAVITQRALQSQVWGDDVSIRVRMGVHTGEATRRGNDYFGQVVNRAARVMSAAPGNQILVSATTAALIDGAEDIELVDVGLRHLKGVSHELRLFGVKASGLAWVDLPVAEDVRSGNLVRFANEYIGPVDVLQRHVDLLPARRLVTLTGPGGVGKTRTAAEMGWMSSELFTAVWMVELAEVVDPGGVGPAVAAVLSTLPQPGMSLVGSIVEWLRGRRVLLILDNCEHVLDPVHELVSAIVNSCPDVTVLATSREPLGLVGERVVPVASLDVADAAELFRSRALAADDSLRFTVDDSAMIDAICQRLDGIPLAIELAAARTRTLSLRDLRTRLDDRFRVLRGGAGHVERHHTLRATVAWSYQLLTETERALFDRLSVFAGSFELEAAEAVCCGDGVDPADVMDLLSSLVGKSMVVVDRSTSSTRFRLLETLRQFGEEQLAESGAGSTVRDRQLAEAQRQAGVARRLQNGPRQSEGDDILAREWPNVRAAFEWAMLRGDPSAAEDLLRVTHIRAFHARLSEHTEWSERVVQRWPDRLRASTYAAASVGAFVALDHDHAFLRARQGLECDGPDDGLSFCAWMAASVLLSRGAVDEATPLLQLAEAAAARSGDPHAIFYAINGWFRMAGYERSTDGLLASSDRLMSFAQATAVPVLNAIALQIRGSALFVTGQVEASLAAYRQAHRSTGELGVHYWEVMAAASLVSALLALGGLGSAEECRGLVSKVHERRDVAGIWWCAEAIANHAALTGDRERAATMLGFLRMHAPPWLPMILQIRAGTEAALESYPDAVSCAVRGAGLTRDEAERLMFAMLPSDD